MKIAIIGAGMASSSIVSLLRNNFDISVFEKSRGLGGRMATRRKDDFSFDHGTQFFTVKSKEFMKFIAPLIEKKVVNNWNAFYQEIGSEGIILEKQWQDTDRHYVGVPAMNSVCKTSLDGINIYINTKITKLIKIKGKWLLIDDNKNQSELFDWVITTNPVEQAFNILPKDITLRNEIKKIKMKARYTLMLGFNNPLKLPFDVAKIIHNCISWISVNSSKPGRTGKFSLVIQSTNTFARNNFSTNPNIITDNLIRVSSNILKINLNCANHIELHKWNYADSNLIKFKCYVDPTLKIAACGDWTINGNVESAFLSGIRTSSQIEKYA